MKSVPKFFVACFCWASLFSGSVASGNEARVTQVFREVKLLPGDAAARPAQLNDQVREGIAVRTGDRSRSELTFPDVTITRLGANTIFTFDRGGHGVNLDGGSVLLRVPKNSGGGGVRTNAISVAITGTTLIVEASRTGRSKLTVLEGSARLSLVKYRGQSREVHAGQMLDVPAGAKTLPMPQDIDLNRLMQTHPLVADFPPLPSRDLILAAARNPKRGPGGEPVYQGQQVDGEPPPPGPVIAVVPTIGLPGLFPGSRNPGRPGRPNGRPGSPTQNPTSNNPPGTNGVTSNPKPPTKIPPRRIPKPTPTPPVIR
ncbi:MAG: FecR domain-containing protein [Chthoniobacterales bacterium]